jgi:hypothetical protein
MTLQEIYEEFWEFIDDNNEVFQRFIVDDKDRRMHFKMKNLALRNDSKHFKNIPKN